MAIAVALCVILLGSVLFHFLGPWALPPLASNWHAIDLTIVITFIITGLVFLAVMAFTVLAIIRYRYRADRKAAYQPDNKKLEYWLTGASALGITVMLVPGLYVYSDVVSVPVNAQPIEAVAKQWGWMFRLPGKDGVLGKSVITQISRDNPFGLDPRDPASQDDHLIQSTTLHLAIDQPVHAQLRSLDVLHNFYVPQFRTKMDAVPGIVSSFWFTPTQAGEYEILCAEYCGIGHFNMRGKVVVQQTADYEAWLAEQPTFEQLQAELKTRSLSVLAQRGEALATAQGCLGCHGFADGQLGPSWRGILGRTVQFTDGTEGITDHAYLLEAIRQPEVKIVKGYNNVMPAYDLSDENIDALIAYMSEQGELTLQQLERMSITQEAAAEPTSWDYETNDPQMLLVLAQTKGCLACHSLDGSEMLGPTWQGLAGSQRTLADGSQVKADRDYLYRAIVDPNAELVEGYPPIMPKVDLSDAQINALMTFIESQ